MKKLSWLGALAALGLLLGGCSQKDNVSRTLEVDVSGGEVVAQTDTHGGFHGDGTAYLALRFADDALQEQIEASEAWRTFPLDDTVRALVYGIEEEADGTSWCVGPYLTDADGEALVPEIEEGYYRLIDHQAEEGKATGADILHRASFHFALGLYDSREDILYFCELDT